MRTSRPGTASRSAAMTEGTSGNKSSILFVRATRTITNNSAFFRFCWNSRVLVRGKKDFEAARGSFSEQRSVLQASAPLLLDGSDTSSLGDGEPDARSEEHSLNSSHLGISYAVFCL